MIYLAAPYSHPDPLKRELRYQLVTDYAAALMRHGHEVFSPITHSHPIACRGGLPVEWYFWRSMNRAILAVCDRVVVLKLDGWQQSKGVHAEIKIAQEYGLPVEYMEAQP